MIEAYLTKEFTEAIEREVTLLKKYATPEEINCLDIDNFDGLNSEQCIYGQMTGSCHSDRAILLIHKCCERVFLSKDQAFLPDIEYAVLNGPPTDKERNEDKIEYYSPLELYVAELSTSNGFFQIEEVINFLKGDENIFEIKTLEYDHSSN